jgi:glycosyltransferase involved in cell wall biosynthesis
MRVSIITVCYNSVDTILDALRSVSEQTYQDIEHIVVDGGSSDGTMDIVRKFSNPELRFISEPDLGIYDAMNKGIALATGDVIGILNSDDFFESENVLGHVVDTFQTHSSAQIVFGDVVFVSPANADQIRRFYSSRRFKPWKLRFGWMPPHPATFVRRSVYDKFGQYELDYQISADYEKFVKWLLVEKLSYARIDRVLVRMRQGGVSTSGIKSNIVLNREIVKACRSNGIYTNELFLLAKIPFKLLELVRRPRNIADD